MILDQLDPDTNQHQHSLLVSASCLALGELGRNGPLPLPQEGTRSKQTLFKWLLQMIKSTKISIKIRERSALALGQLCIGDKDYPWRKDILKGFLEIAKDVKDIEP